MRVACLYDIHANLPALEAVLADVREARAEHIIIGGDALPGPMPRECLDLLYSLDIPTDFIIGNGDRETAAAARGPVGSIIPEFFREAMKWNAGQMRPRDLQAIDSWPLTVQLSIDGIGETLFCHATPRNDTEVFVKTTADDKLQPIFDTLGVQLVVCGHTHMQFDRMVGPLRVVNGGSVGMPFGTTGADWLLLAPGIELRKTHYDLRAAAERFRRTEYPSVEEMAVRYILNPPSEQELFAAWAAAEV
jgi:predicted phosphodiesterase